MPRKSNTPPSDDEMIAHEEARSNNRLHAGARGDISKTINNIHSELSSQAEKISLSDTEAVKKQALKYIAICANRSTFPTLQGLARSLGHSRSSISMHMTRDPNGKTSEFLNMVKDGFSEILEAGALNGGLQPIVSIFLLKACHNYTEKSELHLTTPVHDNKLIADQTIAEIQAKYLLAAPEE